MNGGGIFSNDWQIEHSDIFNIGVNTLLFHQYGIFGYYGKYAMSAVRLAGSSKQRYESFEGDVQKSPMLEMIEKCGNYPFEKFRCECYRNGLIKGNIDNLLCNSFDRVFEEVCEDIEKKVVKSLDNKIGKKIDFTKPSTLFEDSFEVVDDELVKRYKEICKKLYEKCPDECVFSLILKTVSEETPAFMIILGTMKHFTRQKPIEKTEWTDNFGLNNLGFAMSLSERETEKNKSSKSVYTVKSPKFIVKKDVKFDVDDALKNLVGPVKIFDALMSLEGSTKNIMKMYDEGSEELKWKVLDYVAEKYPNYFAGAHGCNCFIINRSCSYDTLVKFLLRYPSTQVGMILNTSQYGERGQHWTAVTLRNDCFNYDKNTKEYTYKTYKNPMFDLCFCCSFGNSPSSLHRDIITDLEQSYPNLSIHSSYNDKTIQTDGNNCGVYSALFLYILYQYPGQMSQIHVLNTDAENFIMGGIFNMRKSLIGCL